MGNRAGLDKRRRMKLSLVCSVVILIAVLDDATGATDPCACLLEKVHTTIKAQLKCEARCMGKGTDTFPEYDPQREEDLVIRARRVNYVCYPRENPNNETAEGQPGSGFPKDCSEIEAFYKKLDDADQMYDKMEKIISDAEQKFGIREPVEPDNVIPPEFEDLTKRFDDIDFKCRFRRRQQVRPSLRSATFFHNTSPDWESKECLEEEAITKKFYTTRRKMHDDDPDAGKIIDEMEKIVSEAEKKWGIWKPDPLSERFSNVGKRVAHIQNYCKFRIANHKTLQHLKSKDCVDKEALDKVFEVSDDEFEKMVIKAEKLVSDAEEEWGIEEDK